MRTAFCLLLILSSLCHRLYGQGSYEVGMIPEFNFGTKISPLWGLDIELAPRFEVFTGDFESKLERNVYFGLLDVTTVFNKTVGVDSKIGFGYLVRFEDRTMAHRFMQQYAFTNPYYGFRLGHRFRTDQTLRSQEALRIRARYRLSSDISLNGEFIDAGEFYIKIGNEYVVSFQNSDTDLEIRIVPSVGYYFDDANKFEIGIDYRANSFIKSTVDHRFWLNISYYFSL